MGFMDEEDEKERKREETMVRCIIMAVAAFLAAIISIAAYQVTPIHISVVNVLPSEGAGEQKTNSAAASEKQSTVTSGDSAASEESGLQEVLVEKSIDINTADREELDKLPGIGPVLADRIAQYREEYGGFDEIEELKNVQGIGEKIFEKIEAFIVV